MTGAPSPAHIRATLGMVKAAIGTARHKACGLSLSQHGLLLRQVADRYAAAAWIETQQNGAAFPLRLWARDGKRAD